MDFGICDSSFGFRNFLNCLLLSAALLLLCGCFKVEDELDLAADGSGVIHLQVQTPMSPEMRMGGGGGDSVIYPPLSEIEARKFFPEKDFKLAAKQTRTADGGVTLSVEAAFTNLNALLASPYARAHALTIQNTNGVIRVRALTAMEGPARVAEIKDTDNAFGYPAMPEMQKHTNEMRVQFRLRLPNAIDAANGTRDGKSATWLIERAGSKDNAEFVARVSNVLEAACPAAGLDWKPQSPVRLALQPFAGLQAGAIPVQATGVDAAKVAASASFVPYSLHVTRTFDLSGEANSSENSAQLSGAIVLPREFKPGRWGEPVINEVVDANGASLKPRDDDNTGRYRSYGQPRADDDAESARATDDAPAKTTAPGGPPLIRHPVTFTFLPPEWSVNEIARFKASLALHYPGGGSEIVKLPQAVPARSIMAVAQMLTYAGDSGHAIKDKRLNELGVKLKLSMAMKRAGMTSLQFSLGSTGSTITDAQVFDASGRPWPTVLEPVDMSGGDEHSCSINVVGEPAPPLSLAIVASGGGQKVEVPITLEKIPIRNH